MNINDTLLTFRETVKNLVINQRIPHATLVKEIRLALVEESAKYPKLRMLKCESYGGYDLSDLFKKWIGYDNPDVKYESHELRMKHAQDMRAFGEFCHEEYPFVASLIQRYEQNELLSRPEYKEFASSFQNIATFRKDKVMHSFHEALAYFGENSADIWKYQTHYDYLGMKYLIEHPDSFPDSSTENFYEKIGLLFASTEYCRLGIANVPQIVDWYIEDYDGMESIRIL